MIAEEVKSHLKESLSRYNEYCENVGIQRLDITDYDHIEAHQLLTSPHDFSDRTYKSLPDLSLSSIEFHSDIQAKCSVTQRKNDSAITPFTMVSQMSGNGQGYYSLVLKFPRLFDRNNKIPVTGLGFQGVVQSEISIPYMLRLNAKSSVGILNRKVSATTGQHPTTQALCTGNMCLEDVWVDLIFSNLKEVIVCITSAVIFLNSKEISDDYCKPLSTNRSRSVLL